MQAKANPAEAILVVSGEPALAETLADELAPWRVEAAAPKAAGAKLREGKFRLVVADEDARDMDSALSGSGAQVIRLQRPIRLSDLLYTIRGQLQGKTGQTREEIMLSGNYFFSPAERTLRSKDSLTRIALTEKEAELLLSLLKQKATPVAREALLKAVWGYSDDIATRTLETHIYRLRGKLRQADETFDIIFSEEGGYALACGQ